MAPPVIFSLRGPAVKTQIFGRYCQELMKAKFDTALEVPKPPLNLGLRAEARQIVDVCYSGMMNIAELKWNFETLFHALEELGSNNLTLKERSNIRSKFPPVGKLGSTTGRIPLIAEPTTFADSEGHVGLWVLTGVLQPQRQEAITRVMKHLSPDRSGPACPEEEQSGNRYFCSPSNVLPAGVLSGTTISRSNEPAPSSYIDLLKDLSESFAVLGGILAVTQPWLFENALAKLESLQASTLDPSGPTHLKTLFEVWAAPFTTFELVCNRETLVQRNPDIPPWAYELIATVGAETNGRMECPDVGYRILNAPGTVVVGAFRILSRGISIDRSEQANVFMSFLDASLKDCPKHYNPRMPTLELWERFFAT